MMQLYLNDPIHIQTGNPTTRTVDPGKQKQDGWMRREEKMVFDLSRQQMSILSIRMNWAKADLQCMMEEWCSPYSSWLSLMKGCSADRVPPSTPPPQFLLFEEDESGGSLGASATGSASPASPFFSTVWRCHKEGWYQCQRFQHPVPVPANLKHTSVHLNEIAAK